MTDQQPQTALAKVNAYFGNPVVRARFDEILSERNAGAYISSVLLAVANSDALQKCSAQSIYTSALRAATLRLSVDPSTRQAYIVPFGNVATLIVGYMGLYHMAIGTSRYQYINVGKLYEGEYIEEDRISGACKLAGGRTGNKIAGWFGSFQLTSRYGGIGHTIHMTVEEIHEHARKYSKGYDNPAGVWKKDPQAMERKTILRLLLSRWGYLDPVDAAILAEIEGESNVQPDDFVNGEIAEAKPARSEADIMSDLGYAPLVAPPVAPESADIPAWTLDTARDVETADGTQLGLLSFSQLMARIEHKQESPEVNAAAQFILDNWK